MPKSVKVRIKCLNHKGLITDEEMDNLIEALETEQIEVIPHAKWETIRFCDEFGFRTIRCSNCVYELETLHRGDYFYCPHCGAQMDKE